MLRSTSQSTAARRSAEPYSGRTYTHDGVTWQFWSLAPGRKDQHWVTDGHRFALADDFGIHPDSQAHRHQRSVERLAQAVSASTLRMADDQFTGRGYDTPSCLVVAESRVGTPAEQAAALKRHSLNGSPLRSRAAILASMRRNSQM